MRVLLTGATGFVGRAVTARLLADGHQVAAWVRNRDRALALLGADAELVGATADPSGELDRQVNRADAIVNLAGEPLFGKRWNTLHKRLLWSSRVESTTRLAVALGRARQRPRVLVSASASGYYGDGAAALLLEDAPPGRDFLAELCVAWERAASSAASTATRVVLLRLGIVLGQGGGALERLEPLFRAGLGGPLGAGSQYVPWLHLWDAAELVARSISQPSMSGAYNAVAPEPVTSREFARALGRVVRRPAWVRTPAWAMRAALGQAASALLASQRLVPARLLEAGFKWRFGALAHALHEAVGGASSASIEPVGALPHSAYLGTHGATYQLRQSVRLAAPRRQVFTFCSSAENLGVVTPPAMALRLASPAPPALREGTTLDYRLKIAGWPQRWSARIESWRQDEVIVDTQQRGPYRSWWHEHRFVADAAGTLLEDRVYYSLPLGPLGRLVHWLFVGRMLRRLFAYRAARLALRFGAQ